MKTFTNAVILFLLSATIGFGQERMTPERFDDLVAAPAANVRLVPNLADLGPFWTKVTTSISYRYETGRVVTEEAAGTSKIISSNCVVFTAHIAYSKRIIKGLTMYDEKAQAIKKYHLLDGTLIESTAIYDYTKKTYAVTSTYGDGVMEIGLGSYSDKESSLKTLVYKHGVLFMTCEVNSKPVAVGN